MSETRIWREWLESQYLGELERIASRFRDGASADIQKDAVQQAYVKFLTPGYREKLRKAEARHLPPEAYLRKSVMNQRLDDAKKRHPTTLPEDYEDTRSDPREGSDLVRLIQETRDLLG